MAAPALLSIEIETPTQISLVNEASGEKANPKTTELTASQLALTEEAPFEEQVTHGTSRDSWLGQARYQEKLSEMQEGNWRPGADPYKETCLRKLSHKHDDFETGYNKFL
ncbi:hypothetical protein E5288_WYG014643 [Bos mutus]|uniref:Uncharacterized protein n=1 Tax=Bos mutus TaxID=72004 RepID=A0A6B0R6V9_9CETA|nr:hypothetical protein [Bos mutus]